MRRARPTTTRTGRRSGVRGAAAAAALLVALALPGRVEALDGLELEWSAPPGCPTGEDVERLVERFLSEATRPRAPVSAQGSIEARPGGRWSLRLTLVRDGASEGPAERLLQGEECGDLAEAAALILALAIDPEAAREAARDGGPVDPGPGTERPGAPGDGLGRGDGTAATSPGATAGGRVAAATATATAARGAGPRRRGTPPLAARAHLAVDLGTLPGLAPGLGLALGAGGRLRGELAASLWPGRQAPADVRPASGAEVSLAAVGARGCASPARAAPIWLCAGVELGWMRGTGYGVSDPRTVRASWAAVGGDVAASRKLQGPAHLWLELGARIALRRPGFALDDLAEVHRAAPLAGRALAGIEVRLP